MTSSERWQRGRRALVAGFLVLLMGVCGLAVLGSVTTDTGVTGFLIGLTLAALPVPVVVGALRWLDRYEPEPPVLLLFAFFWGATVAALVAAVINTASLVAISGRLVSQDYGAALSSARGSLSVRGGSRRR